MTSVILPAHLEGYRGKWRGTSLAEMARQRALVTPGAVAVIDDWRSYSFSELVEDAEVLTVALRALGLERGDIISFQLPNWVEAAVVNLAASMAGLIISPIVPIYRDAEVGQMMADSRCKLLFTTEHFRSFDFAAMMQRIVSSLPELRHVIYVRGRRGRAGYEALLNLARGSTAAVEEASPDSVKLRLYTSGTTGRPKAVLHSQNTLTRTIDTLAHHWGIAAGDALLAPSPVTHISGYTTALEMPFVTGTCSVMMESWNVRTALDLIERHQIVGTIAATPFLQEMADAAIAEDTRLPSLRFFACGGAAVPPDLVRTANRAFAQPCAFRIFGSSEAPLVTVGFRGVENAELAATTDGEVVDYEVRIVDDNGTDLPTGLEGEILLRGPAMFLGYADAGDTREAITSDGFFKTGDLGFLTEANALTITGRKKDLIIRGGENISAKEVEDALHRHPSVSEAAVVSIPHARLGEGVGAYVVLKEDARIAGEILAQYVAEGGLALQKCPELFVFVDALPKTASGKIRKDVLRAWARESAVS